MGEAGNGKAGETGKAGVAVGNISVGAVVAINSVAVAGRGVREAGAQAASSANKPYIKKSTSLPLIFMDSFYPISPEHYIIY